MERLIKQVTDSLIKAGLVEVEVSARHVHLTAEDVEVLFGKGAVLHPKRPLSQKGQFLSEERVTLVGKKGKMQRVAVPGTGAQRYPGRAFCKRLCGFGGPGSSKRIRRY